MKTSQGILDCKLDETSIAVIDFETTGLNAGRDRVIELTVVRIDPNTQPRLVMDTLIHPDRKVAATEIHGITDDDVKDAPHFDEVAAQFVTAVSGCVVAAYNVYFDMQFFEYELRRLRLPYQAPHLCLMYMRPMLKLGNRCSLTDACTYHGIRYCHQHKASSDAWAGGQLWMIYKDYFARHNIKCFRDLTQLKSYKFIESFIIDPIQSPTLGSSMAGTRLKSRSVIASPSSPITIAPPVTPDLEGNVIALYWEELKGIVNDLIVTDEEMIRLAEKSRSWGIKKEVARALHAKLFANALSYCSNDDLITDSERERLRQLHRCLSRLGWAPGD